MLNLAYFKRKSEAFNDENALQENYIPGTANLTYPYKQEVQTITDCQIPDMLDWPHYAEKLDIKPHNPNRFNLNPRFWNNHLAIRQRELFNPLAMRRKFQCKQPKPLRPCWCDASLNNISTDSGDHFLSLFSTHERYRYRILNADGDPCPPFSCEYNHGIVKSKLYVVYPWRILSTNITIVKRDGKLLAVADEDGKISILETDKDAYVEHGKDY
jgi:hypothetical protein